MTSGSTSFAFVEYRFAELKAGRTYVAGKVFDTKREAQAWYSRERAALMGGVDPRAGRETVRTLFPVWLNERRHSVSAKTYVADAAPPAHPDRTLCTQGRGGDRPGESRPPSPTARGESRSQMVYCRWFGPALRAASDESESRGGES